MSDPYQYDVLPRATLASSMDAVQLTLTLGASQGANFKTGKQTLTISLGTLATDPTIGELLVAETVEVESRSGDVFTLTRRNVNGNAVPLTHLSGALVQQLITPEDFLHLQQKTEALELLVQQAFGTLTTGVKIFYPNYDTLKVVPQGSPDMTVKIKAGVGFADSKTCHLTADFDTATIVAPTVSTRNDLVSINSADDLIVVTTGVEGAGVPATPSGHIPLADITILVAQATIETGDISDVRPTY